MAWWVVLVKAVVIAAILVLPTGLTISLGVAHGVAAVVVVGIAVLAVSVVGLKGMAKRRGYK